MSISKVRGMFNSVLIVTAIISVIAVIYTENIRAPINGRHSRGNRTAFYTEGKSLYHGVPYFFNRKKSGSHYSLETRQLFDRNVSILDAAWNYSRNTVSPTIVNGRFILGNTILATSYPNETNAGNYTVLNIGYFEGARSYWIYSQLFQPPESPRKCHCPDLEDVSQDVLVTLEKDPSRTGRFDILFIPRDCGTFRDDTRIWETILVVAPPNQRRVYATFEGANKLKFLTPVKSPFSNKTFHWSWNHHSNSDFPMLYGFYKNTTTKLRNARAKNWAKGETSLVAWMSSWTVTSWRRVAFVRLLQKHLKVDLFGANYENCPPNSKKCEQTIRSYKFYLALENSCCGEYITEKFWRTLSWDIVPIVVGANRSDYERLAPPNSFIYADDYGSVQELAEYIIYLSKNDDEYNKYFSWISQGDVTVSYPPLQEQSVTSRVPPETFFYSCKAVCRVAKKYERNEKVSRYFDPNNDWWCGSCTKCGQHMWIRNFATDTYGSALK